jgi:DNA polymerase III alpha subunit (gram-positive type)
MNYDPLQHLTDLEDNITELTTQFTVITDQHLQQAWMLEQIAGQFKNIGQCLEILHDRLAKIENEDK